MKPNFRTRLVVCAIMVAATLSGCGQNIFKGLAGTAARTASEELKAGNYDAAISQADTTINSNPAVDTLQTAYSIKGTAILMKYQSLPIHLFQTVIDLSNNPGTNIISAFLETLPIDLQNANLAADALNTANTLSSTTNLTISSITSVAPSLNSTAQLNRTIANTSVVIKMLTRYLDIGTDGSVSKNTIAISNGISMADIINYITTPPKSLTYYANSAVDAGTASGIFTDSQLIILDRVSMFGNNLNQLRNIVTNGNDGTFELVDETGTVIVGYPPIVISTENYESAYTAALTQLINAMKSGAHE